MAIWNCTNDTNDIARLLTMALPGVDTDAEMLALDPDKLQGVARMADSFTDGFLLQLAALGDLISNAQSSSLEKGTLQQTGNILRTMTELQEIFRRTQSSAESYSDPETRALYIAMAKGDKAEVARLME